MIINGFLLKVLQMNETLNLVFLSSICPEKSNIVQNQGLRKK